MRKFRKLIAALAITGLVCGLAAGCGSSGSSSSSTSETTLSESAETLAESLTDAAASADGDTIKIGLLFSFGGHEATLESCMYNGAVLAVEEVNAAGGINGKLIEPISEDYNGEPSLAAEKALKLITEDEVVAIVGCCSSSSRQAVKSVVEEYDNLLVYVISYEGQEYSDNIIYMGVVPNQQTSILVPWAAEQYGGNFFFVGNDYVYPRSTNAQAIAILEEAGGTSLGEEYVPNGDTDFASVMTKITELKPDVVFCSLVGDSQTAFYKQYSNYGLIDMGIECVSVALDDLVASAAGWDSCEGQVSCYDYFASIDTPESAQFIEAYNARFTDGSVASSSSAVPYEGVHALAQALSSMDDYSSGSAIADAFSGIAVTGPRGTIVADAENHHFSTPVYIGIAKADGYFDIIYESEGTVEPLPFGE